MVANYNLMIIFIKEINFFHFYICSVPISTLEQFIGHGL
jgi:hypothetical protein